MRTVLTLAVLLTVAPSVAHAAQKVTSAADSVTAHIDAVSALRRFQFQWTVLVGEHVRNRSGVANTGGRCEIRVYDFCYGPLNGGVPYAANSLQIAFGKINSSKMHRMWHKRNDFYVTRYLTELNRIREIIPGDRWINGELVRTALERGRVGEAESHLRKCKDTEWWCDALRAYVLNFTGLWSQADTAWGRILARMSDADRCAWLDPELLLERRAYDDLVGELTCAERLPLLDRFWWLSDPLFTTVGNERRAAHLSRHVAMILDLTTQRRVWATPAMVRRGVKGAAASFDVADPEEPLLMECGSFGHGSFATTDLLPATKLMLGYVNLVMRTGVPTFCGGLGDRDVFTQYPLQRQSFIARAEAVADHLHALESDWSLRDPRAYEFIYGWTRTIHDMTYQDAYFRRGDSARLVVVSNAPAALLRPSFPGGPAVNVPLKGQLWLQQDVGVQHRTFSSSGSNRILFDVRTAAIRKLASVEIELPRGEYGRVRFGSGPSEAQVDQRLGISDVLLTEPRSALAENLDEARVYALGTTRLEMGSQVGLFWEMYGLESGDTATVSIVIVPLRARNATLLGRDSARVADQNSLEIRWDEVIAQGAAISAKAVNVNIASLRAGRYTLSLAVLVPGQKLVESVRVMEIVAPRS